MPGRQPRRLVSPPPQVGISPVLFRRQRVLMKLAAYRPLLVLAGIWVVLMAIAVVAYSQLLHTSTQLPTPAPAATEVPSAAPPKATAPVNPPVTAPAEQNPVIPAPAQRTAAAPQTVTDEDGIALWTWGALIGGCALGCLLISHQLKTPPRAKMAKKKPLTTRKQTPLSRKPVAVSAQTQAALSAPKRLPPYDPTQPLVASAPARAEKSSRPTRATAAPQVTVVEEAVQHRLDWPEDSLINTVDVRQKRSLSSFL